MQRHISHRCSNSKSFDCKTELEESFTAACKSCGCLVWVGGELLLNKEKCLILITDVVSLHTEKDMKEKRVIVQRCSNVQFKGKKNRLVYLGQIFGKLNKSAHSRGGWWSVNHMIFESSGQQIAEKNSENCRYCYSLVRLPFLQRFILFIWT